MHERIRKDGGRSTERSLVGPAGVPIFLFFGTCMNYSYREITTFLFSYMFFFFLRRNYQKADGKTPSAALKKMDKARGGAHRTKKWKKSFQQIEQLEFEILYKSLGKKLDLVSIALPIALSSMSFCNYFNRTVIS